MRDSSFMARPSDQALALRVEPLSGVSPVPAAIVRAVDWIPAPITHTGWWQSNSAPRNCPLCGKSVMFRSDLKLASTGFGHHIRNVHPERFDEFLVAAREYDAQCKAKVRAAEREARERPLRKVVVTGALLDEITAELRGLLGMMEPYYAQCGAGSEAQDLIDRLDALASGIEAATAGETGTGSTEGESPVPQGDAQSSTPSPSGPSS